MSVSDKVRWADSMIQQGRVKDALESMDSAIASDPEDLRLRHHRGLILFQAGMYTEARDQFLAVLDVDPRFTDARNFLGVVYVELGEKGLAEEQFKEALADPAFPTPELTYLNLGLLYASQGRSDEAIEAFRTAVEINPRYYKGHYELASVLDSKGDFGGAAREYEVARPGYERNGDFFYRLGLAYFRLGRTQEAKDTLTRVQDVAPGSRSAAQADELLELIE
jgi:tetratricopeptide (TPR) repeat protein